MSVKRAKLGSARAHTKQTYKGGRRKTKLTPIEKSLLYEWEDRAERLSGELAVRSSKGGSSRNDEKRNHFVSEAYRLVRDLRAGPRGALEDVLAYKVAIKGVRPERRSIFSLNFDALAAEINTPLAKQTRSDYCNALEYADKHEIPPELVIGFIKQVGGLKKAGEKLASNKIEEWFNSSLPWLSS